MEKFREMKEFAEILGVKMAIVQVKPGESNQEAWNRHLKKNPDDASATVKVFNQPVPKRAAAGSPPLSVNSPKQYIPFNSYYQEPLSACSRPWGTCFLSERLP